MLADYSDRPGDATWILRQLIDQGVSGVLYGALRDERALAALAERDAQPGDPFDMEVGGFTGPQAGAPVRGVTQVGVDIDVLSVGLSALPTACRCQCPELTPQASGRR